MIKTAVTEGYASQGTSLQAGAPPHNLQRIGGQLPEPQPEGLRVPHQALRPVPVPAAPCTCPVANEQPGQ
jgi:hypothetical protein